MCAKAHPPPRRFDILATLKAELDTESGTQAGGSAMMTLIRTLPGSKSLAEDDVRETRVFPIAVVCLAVLLLGDVAATLAAIATMG
jgi:hypothetical protein